MRDVNIERDELVEIMERLKAVTQGHIVQELQLKRNIMGQLGFHVQPDGTVTLVESQGQAWQAGLRQNSRLVEICKVAVSTLTYDQMVDLLKTSTFVTLTVIPPLSDGAVRKGCTLQNCKYNDTNYDGDYENVADDPKNRKAPQRQQAVPGNHRKIYERSFSPPRSSNSSGYGTGSSSKSFHGHENRFLINNNEGTGSSSGYSNDDAWYEISHEILGDPVIPALPSKNNHIQRNHSNNTYPSTPKRSNMQQISQLHVSQSHNHFIQPIQHSKIQVSHSLPLQQHINFTIQPLTATIHNTNDYEIHKIDKNNIVKQQNDRTRQDGDCIITRPPKLAEYTTVTHITNDLRNNNDGHSTDSSISDRLYGIGSEDELSTGSGNVSPKTRRKHLSNAQNVPSRNNSPRSSGEAKLRPGVTARSSNRNSANLTSTFQEDLLRLINPDNIETAESKVAKDMRNMSREALNNPLAVHKSQPEVILTMARPATVISNASTTSSPLPLEFKTCGTAEMTKVMSPNKGKPIVCPDALPLPEDMDWPSLVDTANRVIGDEDGVPVAPEVEIHHQWDDVPVDASITSK